MDAYRIFIYPNIGILQILSIGETRFDFHTSGAAAVFSGIFLQKFLKKRPGANRLSQGEIEGYITFSLPIKFRSIIQYADLPRTTPAQTELAGFGEVKNGNLKWNS